MTTTTFTDMITEESQLREIFGWPTERSKNKQIDHLDQHCRAIIAKSPFLLLGTSDPSGRCDVSPKGDYPGFVRVLDEKTIAIPDLPGNNRLDTLTNILNNPQVGLLFLIPGMNETLRVNGKVRLVRDADLLESMAFEGKLPKLAIIVDIQEVFSHCPKAFMRSKLWAAESQIDRKELPSFAEILRDHAGLVECDVDELQRELDHRAETMLH
ncbi:MAG: pyridoxamine 5'-phosphate oxidase family protein [Dehalococcoidia bacterium]